MAAETITNRKWVLARFVEGREPVKEDMELVSEPVAPLQEGQFLVKVQFLSVDPYHRFTLASAKSYFGQPELRQVIHGEGVGEVVRTRNGAFPLGSLVSGYFGYQEYCVVSAVAAAAGAAPDADRTEPQVKWVSRERPAQFALGKFGMPSFTAFYGVTRICKPKAGEVVFVSGAAGAVGAMAGQVARHLGARVFGSAGTEEKLALMVERYGYEGGVVYKNKTAQQLREEIQKLLGGEGKGIDCYFENCGGPITDAVLQLMNPFGRVAVCGQIEDYNKGPETLYKYESHIFVSILMKQLTVEGFLMARWHKEDPGLKEANAFFDQHQATLYYKEDISEGIESAQAALYGLYSGQNFGKKLVKFY